MVLRRSMLPKHTSISNIALNAFCLRVYHNAHYEFQYRSMIIFLQFYLYAKKMAFFFVSKIV